MLGKESRALSVGVLGFLLRVTFLVPALLMDGCVTMLLVFMLQVSKTNIIQFIIPVKPHHLQCYANVPSYIFHMAVLVQGPNLGSRLFKPFLAFVKQKIPSM